MPGSDAESGSVNTSAEQDGPVVLQSLKNRRRHLRGRITRTVNRVQTNIERGDPLRRIKREMNNLEADFKTIRDVHSEMYNHTDQVEQIEAMNKWEEELLSQVYALEENFEDYLASNSGAVREGETPSSGSSVAGSSSASIPAPSVGSLQPTDVINTAPRNVETEQRLDVPLIESRSQSCATNVPHSRLIPDAVPGFDAWIETLVEFQETVIPNDIRQMSVAEALYKLEASRDMPVVELVKFDGCPLQYISFMERFKVQIHSKPHLSDDMRMIQLRMHLTGEAERAVQGFGTRGTMYATALKTLHDQFGQPSLIARAFVNNLIKGTRIGSYDKARLREFSMDIINCIAALKQLNYFADVNATETLRSIVKRLPDPMIDKWKSYVVKLREQGHVPSIEHISGFVKRRVKALFDPDFGDVGGEDRSGSTNRSSGSKQVYSTQYDRGAERRSYKCYVCENDHRVPDCPKFIAATINERFQHAKELRLCYSCLNKGHSQRDCRTKWDCSFPECNRQHHRLLHTETREPSTVNSTEETEPKSMSSILNRGAIMPVVRVKFRAQNGRIKEGNVLVDSGAGTSIIRKDFAQCLGLHGESESLKLSLVGDRSVDGVSQRTKFHISPVCGVEEYEIEAYEMDKTTLDSPSLDRQWLDSFPHLRGVHLSHQAGPVDLILGVQYTHLHSDIEIRQGLPFEPVAKRSALGWYIIGSTSSQPVVGAADLKTELDGHTAMEKCGTTTQQSQVQQSKGVYHLMNGRAEYPEGKSVCKHQEAPYPTLMPELSVLRNFWKEHQSTRRRTLRPKSNRPSRQHSARNQVEPVDGSVPREVVDDRHSVAMHHRALRYVVSCKQSLIGAPGGFG